jgi:pimeloyl-ACP methyl ester carboxylesterase
MLGWPDDFCTSLAERGLYVIRFDNRDVGLSTHLHDAPAPDPLAAFAGDLSSASYTLSDMAADAAGLLDALELDSAHVVGVSMGGMIAQTIAIEYPERVRSLTSIMSTTGDRSVGQANEAAMGALLRPPATSREEEIERTVAVFRVIGSPGFELDEAWLRQRAGIGYDRAHDPVGPNRQLVAIVASGDRTEKLRSLNVPTLVVHGADDPLVNVSGGRATAEAIPGAWATISRGPCGPRSSGGSPSWWRAPRPGRRTRRSHHGRVSLYAARRWSATSSASAIAGPTSWLATRVRLTCGATRSTPRTPTRPSSRPWSAGGTTPDRGPRSA